MVMWCSGDGGGDVEWWWRGRSGVSVGIGEDNEEKWLERGGVWLRKRGWW